MRAGTHQCSAGEMVSRVKAIEIKDRNHLSVLLRACREDDPVPRAMAEFIQRHIR